MRLTVRSRSSANDATPAGPAVLQHSFTSLTADVVLRSSDTVDFRVHRVILSEASTIFETMFSLPQPVSVPPTLSVTTPPATPNGDDGEGNSPAVTVTEDSKTLNALLGILYPGKGPQILDVTVAGQVLAAADKYIMLGVLKQLEHVLLRREILEKDPMAVYALSCAYNLPQAAVTAAKETLKHPSPGPRIPEFRSMSATALHNLLDYRQKCAVLIEPLIDDPLKVWDASCGVERYAMNYTPFIPTRDLCKNCPSKYWFTDYLNSVKTAYTIQICGSAVRSSKLRSKTVYTVKTRCSACAGYVPTELEEFSERLESILDSQIAQVSSAIESFPVEYQITNVSFMLGSVYVHNVRQSLRETVQIHPVLDHWMLLRTILVLIVLHVNV